MRCPLTASPTSTNCCLSIETFPTTGDDPAACLHANPKAEAVIEALTHKAGHETLTWPDMDRLEVALLHVLPEVILRNMAWSLRARYFEVAGPSLAALYKQSKPASWDDATVAVEALRADLECLHDEMLKYRTFLPARDQVRDRISRNAARWTLGTTLAGAVVLRRHPLPARPAAAAPALTMMLAMLGGAIGGFVSMQRRLQRPARRACRCWTGSSWRPSSSACICPRSAARSSRPCSTSCSWATTCKGRCFPHVDEASLHLPINFGGLIVWSFLAGFAERLVPDVLTRLVSAARAATTDKAHGQNVRRKLPHATCYNPPKCSTAVVEIDFGSTDFRRNEEAHAWRHRAGRAAGAARRPHRHQDRRHLRVGHPLLPAGRIGPFVVNAPMVLGHEASGVITEVGERRHDAEVGRPGLHGAGHPRPEQPGVAPGHVQPGPCRALLGDPARAWRPAAQRSSTPPITPSRSPTTSRSPKPPWWSRWPSGCRRRRRPGSSRAIWPSSWARALSAW